MSARRFCRDSSKIEGRIEDESVGRCAAEYSCQPGHASVVAALIHRFAGYCVIREIGCGPVTCRPGFECCGAFFWRQTFLCCRKRRSLDHGKKILLQSHSVGLGLCQQSGFDLRFEIQGNGHNVNCNTLSLCLACQDSPPKSLEGSTTWLQK